MPEAPPLSVIIPVRDGPAEAEAALEALVPQAESLGAEVVVVGGAQAPAPSPNVRVIAEDDRDLLRLRLRAIRESRGEIVAIGEDHAVPRPDWCEAILRAHRDTPKRR